MANSDMNEARAQLPAPATYSPSGEGAPPAESDVCQNRHGGAETSVAAFRATPPETRETQRRAILDLVVACGAHGATCEEVEVGLNMRHQTASARISELSKGGQLVYDKLRRRTQSGHWARVYHVA